MSSEHCYHYARALIERDQVDWLGDGVLCQLVTLELSDDLGRLEPAVCMLGADQARELAFGLLCVAEHAQRLTRGEREQ